MTKVFDKNGKEITVGCEVEVPEPNGSDIHLTDFVGIVADTLENGNVIVEDQDSDFFTIEAKRLRVIDNEDNTLTDEFERIVAQNYYTPDQD